MKRLIICCLLFGSGYIFAEGVGRTIEQDMGLPDKEELFRPSISFHLMDNEKSIAIAYDGKLVEGRKLNKLCLKLNQLADALAQH